MEDSPPPPPPPPLFTTRDESVFLASAQVKALLGSGSNGVVLAVKFPTPLPDPSRSEDRGADSLADKGNLVALKIMSHFWDRSAIALLDCERDTLQRLPRHPNVIRILAEFPATIPPSLGEFLTPDMRSGVEADAFHVTQCLVMDYHPSTLEAYRALFPLPLPWHVMWRLARDLVAALAHLQRHRTVHLDVKADNILVAHDGRAVLTDFGISRVFAPPSSSPVTESDGEQPLLLPYEEPFPLLMNRLVLAPEVLLAHDTAKVSWRALREAASPSPLPAAPVVPFSQQGIWSAGVVLYELACWFGHEPSYPEAGGGVRGGTYSLAGLPPLPCDEGTETDAALGTCAEPAAGAQTGSETAHPAPASSARTHRRPNREPPRHASPLFARLPSGAIAYTSVHRGYPREFCALMLAMLDSDPATRVTAADALLALEAMRPVYVCDSSGDAEGSSSRSRTRVLPDGCPVECPELPHAGCAVLLRHYSGVCRVVHGAPTDSVGAVLDRWSAGTKVVVAARQSTESVAALASSDLVDVVESRVLLGGALVSRTTPLVEVCDLVAATSRTSLGVESTPLLVFDLVPAASACLAMSADYLLTELRAAAVFASADQAWHGCVSSTTVTFPSALYSAGNELPSDFATRQRVLLEWLRTYGSSAAAAPGTGRSSNLPDINLREALLYRVCLALTGLSNAALREDASAFPFSASAEAAVETVRLCPGSHEALAAAVGLLRNVTCTEDESAAASMIAAGAVDAALDAALTEWPLPEASASSSGLIKESSTAPDRKRLRVIPPSEDSPRSAIDGGAARLVSAARLHAADARLAEDAILAVSNLLRFDSHQHIGIPFARCARLVATAIPLYRRSISVHESSVRLLRYVCAIPGVGVAEAVVSSGALTAICSTLEAFPGNADVVSDALHVVCSVLVFDSCRRAEVCPYERLAAAVVAVMARSEHLESAGIQALGATVLRNLACVIVDPLGAPGSPGVIASAALAVANAGAPAVLEAAMERLPHVQSVQENGRCALYNLLLIGAGDARAALRRIAELEVEMAGLRLARVPSKQQQQQQLPQSSSHSSQQLQQQLRPESPGLGKSVGGRTSFSRTGSFSPTASAGGPRTPRTPLASSLPPALGSGRAGRTSSSSFVGASLRPGSDLFSVNEDGGGGGVERVHSRQRLSVSSVASAHSLRFLAPIIEAAEEAPPSALTGGAAQVTLSPQPPPEGTGSRWGARVVGDADHGSKPSPEEAAPRATRAAVPPLHEVAAAARPQAARLLHAAASRAVSDDVSSMHRVSVDLDDDVGVRRVATAEASHLSSPPTAATPPQAELRYGTDTSGVTRTVETGDGSPRDAGFAHVSLPLAESVLVADPPVAQRTAAGPEPLACQCVRRRALLVIALLLLLVAAAVGAAIAGFVRSH